MATIVATSGASSVVGTSGDDQITVPVGVSLAPSATINGGDGVDTLYFDVNNNGSLSSEHLTFLNIEHLVLSNGLSGSGSVDLSTDQIRGVDGSISGQSTVQGLLSIWIDAGSGAVDFSHSPQGLDVTGIASGISITGTPFADELTGLAGIALYGGAGDDTLAPSSATVSGGDGNDSITVNIGDGAGTIDGGAGNDTLNLIVNVNRETIRTDDIDFVHGTPYIYFGGEVIENIEQVSSFGVVGSDDTIFAGQSTTSLIVSGVGDAIYTSAITIAAELSGYGDSENVIHVIPGPLNQQISLLEYSYQREGLADLNFSSAISAVHYGVPDGQPINEPQIYVGASQETATSSATIEALQVSVTGGVYDDVLTGTPSYLGQIEELLGGAGDDTITAGYHTDVLDGGAGRDTLSFDIQVEGVNGTAPPAGVAVDLSLAAAQDTRLGMSVISGFETLIGSQGADTLSGSDAGDALSGIAGDDVLQGRGGNDTLTGGLGSDTLDGGDGVDTATYAGFAHDYALAVSAGAGTVAGGREGGTDTLTSIENLQFLDGTLTFDEGSTAAQIVRLYDSFLGRAPDAAGFEGYLRFIAEGHTLQDMADNAAASPEFAEATAGLTDAQFVTYVYEHSLHREPDPGGLTTYVADLENGTFTRASLIVQAAESPEHVALTAGVVAAGLWIPNETVEGLELLYDGAVQRQPDPTGLAGYGALVAQGVSFKDIANQMSNSAEFLAAHANQTDAQYVDSLYVAEVGRHADPAGLAAYTAELANGETRGDILYETAFSQEHQSHVLAYYDPLLGS